MASADRIVGDTNLSWGTTDTSLPILPPKVQASSQSNILNSYRSYNYIFTLAALKQGSMEDSSLYRDSTNYFVVAKSGGKGTKGINSSFAGTALVDSFNKNSAGRFDMFIDNVQIDTIMGFSEKTNTSVATKLSFDIFEPYSMSGFIEALQVSAVAAGYDQYINCPYMLKMEFIGYNDTDDLPNNAETIPNSTRYFIFSFTGLDITVNENGAHYRCNGVPHNERGFGEPAKLKSNIQITGTTVKDILKTFQDGINKEKEDSAASVKGVTNKNNHDDYEIVFPYVDSTGITSSDKENEIASSKVHTLLKSKTNYKFADPGEANTDPNIKYDPNVPSVSFMEQQNIQDCIAAIIRDSDYTRKIVETFPSSIDSYGMVDYFIINVETIDKKVIDETANKPYYTYRYVVIPYKMHYTRIPLTQSTPVDTSKKYLIATRSYNYLYTGKNIDIKELKLQFNTLFFQAIPKSLGNKVGVASQSDAVLPIGDTKTQAPATASTIIEKQFAISTAQTDARQSQKNPGNMASGTQSQSDPYYALSVNMHQAILDNVDQCSIEMEIIGDPFYLVTSGMGNGRPKISNGITDEGEASYNMGDVMVLITFKNPVDIDEVTGEAIFSTTIGPYSGLFRVINVVSKFKDGIFLQTLHMLRIPAQLDGLITSVPTGIISKDNPIADPTSVPTTVVSSIPASTDSLLSQIANSTLPTSGLPGAFSSIVKGASTVVASVGTVAGVVNQIASAASGNMTALNGLSTSIPSSLRMISSGLSSLSLPSSINQAGASINAISQTANSISGISNISPSGLATAATNAGISNVTCLGSSAMSSINQLGASSAGLLNGVAAKIDALSGTVNTALNTKLKNIISNVPSDVDLNAMPGLSLDIPSSSIANIPASQPQISAPIAESNAIDIAAITAMGGNIAKLGGTILAGADASALGGKLSSIQSTLNSVSGNISSIESTVNSIKTAVAGGLPTTAGIEKSVLSAFGSKINASPLASLMTSIQSNKIG